MELFSGINLVDAVIDEIALEGLEGITLQALWDRLALRFNEKDSIPPKLMEQIWDICLQVRELSFYQLPTPRPKLVIFNRYEFVDPDFGIIFEPDDLPNDIYPHCPIDDVKNGIKGSCSSYHTRKDIGDTIKTLNVHEAQEIYGQTLVVVASQTVRNNALMDKTVCPNLEMTVTQYCFLERVGRARYHGEVTQGKLSLSLLLEDPRSLFYHRKFLLRHKLVTKQLHHQKSNGHGCSSSLLHLPRFFVERKPKITYLAQKVIEILKSRDNYLAEYSEIKKELGIENSVKKLFKTACFQNFVKTDQSVPYRTVYPNAPRIEWQRKNTPSREKTLRIVQLIDKNIDANDLWAKDDPIDDDEPFELEISEQKYSVPFLQQANELVESSGPEGLSQSELAMKMGLTKLQSRTFFRNLAKTNIVATYMNDMGRQRVTKYVSRKYENNSRMSKQFKVEINKMRKLVETPLDKCLAGYEETTFDNDSTKDTTKETIVETRENNCSLENGMEIVNTKEIDEETIDNDDDENEKNSDSLEVTTKIVEDVEERSRGCKRTFETTVETEDSTMEIVQSAKLRKLSEKILDDEENNLNSDDDDKNSDNFSENSCQTDGTSSIAGPAMTTKPDVAGVMDDLGHCDMANWPGVTYRLLKRANMIIESVKEHKVVDVIKLTKMITEEEEKEGYDVRIDKKSLIRLLKRLAKDGLVKNIRLTLSASGKEKSLTFICDPSVDVNHTYIRSAVEQAKIKYCLVRPQKEETTLQSNAENLDFGENADEINTAEKLQEIHNDNKKISMSDLTYDGKAGKRYGYSPKFIRMKTMHTFLFYLIYEHPGEPTESKEKMLDTLCSKGLSIDKSVETEIDGVYNTEVGWKMFVPPLPKHNGYPPGWAMMGDIILRMPLSIFVKVHQVMYVVKDFDNYINHPIRKHLLVKDMPVHIRNILFVRRKYIHSIHDVFTRLCYIGLLQFGHQRMKEKDRVFVYLNRQTELSDTTTSAAHYHLVEKKMYPVTKFRFNNLQTIDKYWYKLWSTCVNTRLGGRLVVQGKKLILEDLDKKLEMIESMKPRNPQDAPKLDVGNVPGDRRGASGIDSAFFSHLKRNWSWESTNYNLKKNSTILEHGKIIFEGERYTHMAKVKPKPLRFTEFRGLKKITGPTTVDAGLLKKSKIRDMKNDENSNVNTKKKSCLVTKNLGINRQRCYVRRVLPRKTRIRQRVKYDDVDHSALQRMDKLRVDWDKREDNILLVCKVAKNYLCPNPRRQFITFTDVRDVLRSYSIKSHNKTSIACRRRLYYILKKPQTFHSVALGVEELKQNFYVNRRYGNIVDKIRKQYGSPRKCDEQLIMVFRDLVAYIAKKNYDIADMQSTSMSLVIKTIEEFKLFHEIKRPTKLTTIQGFHDETTNDVHSSTINSVIHSSMCCGKDRRSWAYQLFRIYQQYPEWLLRSSMAKIRTDHMISVKKNYAFAMRKQSMACMPMSSSQYQLSSGYVKKFNTKLPYTVYKECYEFFVKLFEAYKNFEKISKDGNEDLDGCSVEGINVNGGTVAAVHDYINIGILNFDIEIPRHIIMLNPELGTDDERYTRIARRYRDILRNIEHINVDEIFDDVDREINDEKKNVEETKNFDENFLEIGEELEKDEEMDLEVEERSQGREEKDDKITEETKKINSKILDCKKNCRTTKFRDNNLNDDTEACETDQDVNFDDDEEDDVYEEEIEDQDEDDDDFICFLDGRKMKLTNEDIERSGCKINVEDDDSGMKIVDDSITESPSNDDKFNDQLKNNNVENKLNVNELENISNNLDDENLKKIGENDEKEDEILMEETMEEKEKKRGPVRVNDIIRDMENLKKNRRPDLRIAEVNDIDKRCTRIAVLKMREELNDLTTNDSHHAHEYFVLNMFKIFYSFVTKKNYEEIECQRFLNFVLPEEFLPITNDVFNVVIDYLKKFATFPKMRASYENFKNDLGIDGCLEKGMDAVYEFVQDKRDVGADLDELALQFYGILGDGLYEILSILKNGRLLLRSGVKTTRYIHQNYADPWLIHSYKIMRLQREGLPPVTPGFLSISDTSEDKTKQSKENNPDNDTSIDDEGSSSQRKLQKSRTCLLQTKDVYRSAKLLDLDSAEEIRIVIRPWIRVDGTLNRRVLDRMLGGVLSYCLIHPGTPLTKIQEKFAPAIQPFHTKELVEILEKLKCLKIGCVRKTRVTMMSKPSSIKPTFSRLTDRIERSEDELMVEPELGATLIFGLFLSNRSYTSDFLA